MNLRTNEKSQANSIRSKLRLSVLAAGITLLLGSPLANAWTESPDGFSFLRQNFSGYSLPYYNSIRANHDMGDVDGDGDIDIVATDQGTLTKRIYLNRGDGCFLDPATDGIDDIPATYWGGIALGDFDGDGDLDAFSANDDGGTNSGALYDEIWMNDGAGHFTDSGQRLGIDYPNPPYTLPSNYPTRTIDAVAADADGDGDLDVLVSNNGAYLYFNDGNGRFDLEPPAHLANYIYGYTPQQASILRGSRFADLDGDGDLDIWLVSYGSPDRVLWNVGTGGNIPYSGSGLHDGMYEYVDGRDKYNSAYTNGVAFSDFDGDGDLDVMLANQSSSGQPNVAFQNNGNKTFTQVWLESVNSGGYSIDAGDIDGDGDLDFATNRMGYFTDYTNTDPALRFVADYVGFPGYTSMTKLVDVDGDGDLDSVTTTRYSIVIDLWKETDGQTRCFGPVAVSDTDGDGIDDDADNCPDVANPDQADNDTDGVGDVCDSDDDDDGVADDADNCPFTLGGNADQTDSDGDDAGDICDEDLDGDGVSNDTDICPNDADPDQTDTDGDGAGDACDDDDDNDGFLDITDNCPTIFNDVQEDLDGDTIGDACDADLDADGVLNEDDNCPITLGGNANQTDTDFDGDGDVCDTDDDDDGVPDGDDNCPLASNFDQTDADDDGIGDACNDAFDTDGDEWANDYDNCPSIANGDQADFDFDGYGDVCDADVDGDGVDNNDDKCAGTLLGETTNANGCTIAQLCPCDGPKGMTTSWKNHGKYVSCVAQAANDWRDALLISDSEHGDIVSEAGQSSCGAK